MKGAGVSGKLILQVTGMTVSIKFGNGIVVFFFLLLRLDLFSAQTGKRQVLQIPFCLMASFVGSLTVRFGLQVNFFFFFAVCLLFGNTAGGEFLNGAIFIGCQIII